ncbi:haloacid dehalogenase [Enterococcus florum]|uniref:Haloacid dehalogenase n=1 Tax=Enterococcus florum TaxID=2480627 RepID=A0A4P5P6A3_9ENTE|nr:HAD family phosphatase [Enterococcus florum]GCF93270.1 haloacid dehalogenase [Enterococcus florum]
MIKNIVFDMGNVLVDFDPWRFVGEKTADPAQQKQLIDELFGSVDWLRFDKGTITKEALRSDVKERLPELLHPIADDLLDTWYLGLHPLPQMAELPRELKEKGYRIYLLSNAPEDFYLFKETVPSHEAFDGFFISSDWRLSKPEAAIYQAFFAHFQLNPAECFFIDDTAANILAAEEAGMAGFHFRKNPEKLKAALEQF